MLPFSTIILVSMLYQIVSLLLEVAVGVVSGACLLRLYMQYLRVPMSLRSGNPLANFVFALTNWLVLPLRRVFRPLGQLDSASLVAAYLLQLTEFGLLWLMAGDMDGFLAVPILALFGLIRMALASMTGAVIIYALLSWVPSHSVLSDVIERLVAPALVPIRSVLPLVGGIDLSPLILLVILQVLSIVLGSLQAVALMMV